MTKKRKQQEMSDEVKVGKKAQVFGSARGREKRDVRDAGPCGPRGWTREEAPNVPVQRINDTRDNDTFKSNIMFWTLGSISGATAVAFGAFGAHGLKKKISDPSKIAAWNTAAHYQVQT